MTNVNYMSGILKRKEFDVEIKKILKKDRITEQRSTTHPRQRRGGLIKRILLIATLAGAAYGGYHLYKNDHVLSNLKNYFPFNSGEKRKTLEHKVKENPLTYTPRKQQEPEEVIDFRKLGLVKGQYKFLVSDNSIENPFIISSELVDIIKNHTKDCNGEEEKAKAIYDWIEENIDYGTKKRTNGYKNSEEVLEQREGVCGEMAYVYVTMARCCGLKSNYVSVKIDSKGDRVAHACAAVDVNGHPVLVDPAYHTFDVKHKEYKILTDKEVLKKFHVWREN